MTKHGPSKKANPAYMDLLLTDATWPIKNKQPDLSEVLTGIQEKKTQINLFF